MARALTLLAALVVALSAAACGGDEAGSGGESASIRFMVFGDPEELKAYRTLISALGERQSDVRVQLVEASDRDDLIARLSTSFAGGSPPDVFLINYRFYGQFASRGVLEPLEERVDDSDEFDQDDFYPQALDAFRWEGKLTCLPQNISSLVVYYNRDVFRRYRVPEPRAAWTWNEFVGTAVQLTRDRGGRILRSGDPEAGGIAPAVYGLGVEPTLIRIAPFVWSNGGRFVDNAARPTRLTLGEPKAREALGAFLELRSIYGVIPSDVEVEAEDDESRFANGRLAMLLSSRRSTPTFRTITAFDWDVAALPRFARPAGILHSDAYCMTTASDDKDATWRFIEFANSPEGQRIVAETGRTVPSLKEVADSDAFLDPAAKPRNSRVFLDGISTIKHVPTVSTWPEIEDAAEGVLENGLHLAQPAEHVARELDRVTRPLFARARR
jgi:multiple sugar transport system substrate-binding protein